MCHKLLPLCFTLLLGCSLAGQSGDEKATVEFSGYIKDLRAAYINTLPGDGLVMDNFLHNRLNFRWFPNSNWTVAFEARNRFFYGEFTKMNANYARLIDYNDFLDLSWTWLDEPSLVGHSILDRAYIEYKKDKFEARLGRQRINWGISTVWNPNDIFNAFNFFDWDYEERPGSDALRLQYYTGFASRVELAAKMADSLGNAVIAGLWKFNKWSYDFQLLGGITNGDATLGLGWAGYINTLGFKGEATYFHPYKNFPDTSGTLSATAGLDYSFPSGLYLQLGGLYSSNGVTTYDGTNLLNFNVSAKNLSPFKYNLIFQGSFPINPLFKANLGAMYSPGPNATTFFPGITLSLKQNWELDALSQIFLVNTNSYQSLANVLYVRLKWSF